MLRVSHATVHSPVSANATCARTVYHDDATRKELSRRRRSHRSLTGKHYFVARRTEGHRSGNRSLAVGKSKLILLLQSGQLSVGLMAGVSEYECEM